MAVLVTSGTSHVEPEKKLVEMEKVPETGVTDGDAVMLPLTDEVELAERLCVID